MKAFLKSGSLLVLLCCLLTACARPYHNLRAAPQRQPSVLQQKPQFQRELYRCVVDGKMLFGKFHLSGLLFFKKMPDSSIRTVFQNEMGFTFFDFEWSQNDSFRVNQVIPQLQKEAVLRTLRKDFEMFLMLGLDSAREEQLERADTGHAGTFLTLHRFPLSKGTVVYTAGPQGVRLVENIGRSRVVSIRQVPAGAGLPASARFIHHKAHFTIDLKKIDTHADE